MPRRAMRPLRWLLTASLAVTLLSAGRIALSPDLSPWRDASAEEVTALTDRLMAKAATPESLARHIDTRLSEDPRNWVALTALRELATDRALMLPPATLAAYDAALAADSGLLAHAANCAACAYDPAACSLSTALLCQAPVALTPLGDIAGLSRGAIDYMQGAPVDRLDVALSAVGLGASALIVVSGGTSATVKAGAGLTKLAHRMNLVSPRLAALIVDRAAQGIDWIALRAVRSVDDLPAVLRAEALAPLAAIAADLGRIRDATDTATALHLLPLIDDATDARRLSTATQALGPRVTAQAEMLGKSRLLRATVRVTKTALALTAGLVGLALSLALLLASAVQQRLYRALLHRQDDTPN